MKAGGESIKAIFKTCEATGISDAVLARGIGVSHSAVHHWRAGRSGMAATKIRLCAAFLKLDPHELLLGNAVSAEVALRRSISSTMKERVLAAVEEGLGADQIDGLTQFTPETVALAVKSALDHLATGGRSITERRKRDAWS